MSDERHTYERYRGGGREHRDRRNRQDRYSPAERRANRTTDYPGVTDRGQREDTSHWSQPARRHASTGQEPPADEPGYGQDPMQGRPTGRTDDYPGLDYGQSADREGQVPEIPAGSQRSSEKHRLPAGPFPRSDHQRPMDDRSWAGEPSPRTGERYRQRYGQPVGQQPSDQQMRDDRFQQRRSTSADSRSRPGEHDAERGSRESGRGDRRREQPRDPETGRFLPKDEAADGE